MERPIKSVKGDQGAIVDAALYEFKPVGKPTTNSSGRATGTPYAQLVEQFEQRGDRQVQIPGVAESASYTLKKIRSLSRTVTAQLYLAKHSGQAEAVVIKIHALNRDWDNKGKEAFRGAYSSFREFIVHRNLQHVRLVFFLHIMGLAHNSSAKYRETFSLRLETTVTLY